MKYYKNLTSEKWNKLSLPEQLANVGSEVGRALNWREKDREISERAFFRALELLELTIADPKNKSRLKELCRTREILIDHLTGANLYRSTKEQWEKYFLPFNFLARKDSRGLGTDLHGE